MDSQKNIFNVKLILILENFVIQKFVSDLNILEEHKEQLCIVKEPHIRYHRKRIVFKTLRLV